MYAVIMTGGKQHKVTIGETLEIEKISQEPGEIVTFDHLLLVGQDDNIQIGTPEVVGAKVIAEVVSQARQDKVRIIKFRRRKHYMKRQGHRQYYTKVKITDIKVS
jgi:large subunit ribosomal protein L21